MALLSGYSGIRPTLRNACRRTRYKAAAVRCCGRSAWVARVLGRTVPKQSLIRKSSRARTDAPGGRGSSSAAASVSYGSTWARETAVSVVESAKGKS